MEQLGKPMPESGTSPPSSACRKVPPEFDGAAVDVHVDEELDTEGASIPDDYLFVGKQLSFTGSAHSLYLLCQDAVLAARTVDLTGNFGSPTFAAGDTVHLADAAEVAGGFFAAGRRVEIAGDVGGDLYAGARRLVISGRIDGDVTVGAD
ncbi:MAG: hypothetical protein ACOC2Q_05015, partial [Spirochaetota bacterium]